MVAAQPISQRLLQSLDPALRQRLQHGSRRRRARRGEGDGHRHGRGQDDRADTYSMEPVSTCGRGSGGELLVEDRERNGPEP